MFSDVYVCVQCLQKSEEGGGPLELDFQMVVSCHVGARKCPWAPSRAASAVNYRPAPTAFTIKKCSAQPHCQ